MGFAQARELLPYLRDLGVSHLYLPPSFQARAGSTHGYDVVDPTRFSEELGGEQEFDALAAAAQALGLGLILDVVPNHMATDDANRYWADPGLRAKYFDIDERTGRHRRFFDVDHLAAVRQEDPEVFAETHKLVLRLAREGVVDGLRVDHPDGLADPAGYLARLREGGAANVWVEKILDPGEPLRDWPVQGTVGYEFLNDVAALFVDPAGEASLTDLWVELSGDDRPFGEVAFEAKLEQVRGPFAVEADRLRGEAPREVGGLERALASLPVYRTYVEPWSGRVEDADREAIGAAGLPESLARVLTLQERGWDAFVTRFQQTTPAIMAKGVEDTAFYRYARLLALNDVGGDPSRFSVSVDAFHAANLARPTHNLLITQTHDTKRSGDVRARLGALAGMAEDWAAPRPPLVRGVLAAARAGRRRALLHLPDAGRRVADRGRPARGVRGEGAARGQAQHELDRARHRLRGPRQGVLPQAVRAPPVPVRLRAVRRRGRACRGARRARPAAAQADRPGRARHLPGRRAARAGARRSRQPPPGRLDAPPRPARRGRRRRRGRPTRPASCS